jgi:UDPglucose--hexose-1-phosphate uridylyltransferase
MCRFGATAVSELRWHPLLGEWVAIVPSRGEEREGCQFCASARPADGERRPFDVAVVENRDGCLALEPDAPTIAPATLTPVRAATGVCEVVLYALGRAPSLARLPVAQVHRVVRVWADRFESLGRHDEIKYVLAFEDRTGASGDASTTRHIHGEVYGYPFVPVVAAREIERSREHEDRTGNCLVCDVVAAERADAKRVVFEQESIVAVVPFFARHPLEIHLYPTRHASALTELFDDEQRDLAAAISQALKALEALTKSPSYRLALHQRPTDGMRYDFYHFHVEIVAPDDDGCARGQAGSGVDVNRVAPEQSAAALREVLETLV